MLNNCQHDANQRQLPNVLLGLTVDDDLAGHSRQVDLLIVGTLLDENGLGVGGAGAQSINGITNLSGCQYGALYIAHADILTVV